MLGRYYKYYLTLQDDIQLHGGKWYHLKALRKLRNKDVLRCVFFATFEETWKYDVVYQLMEKHPRFDPLILVCPIVNYGYDNMIQRMDSSYSFFQKKGYQVQKAYHVDSKSYVDVRKDLHPDIIFYTNPYKGLVDDRYFITEFKDVLTIYVPYFYNDTADYELAYDEFLLNVVWRRYLETDMHLKMAARYSRNHGRNAVVTGYPGIEEFLSKSDSFSGADWKVKDPHFKRIIWAPHHSIYATDAFKYASFMLFCDTMLDLAVKYKDQIQFAFKPHPLLRNKLERLWGREKTDAYYEKWSQMPNTTVVEGDYVDLFLTSDAMIHDSGSFIAEYLYLNKPVLRTLNGIELSSLHNEFGLCCLENHYKAGNASEIDRFIQNVIAGVDPLKTQRTEFIHEVLIPKGSPSQNIIDDILDSINHQILYRH